MWIDYFFRKIQMSSCLSNHTLIFSCTGILWYRELICIYTIYIFVFIFFFIWSLWENQQSLLASSTERASSQQWHFWLTCLTNESWIMKSASLDPDLYDVAGGGARPFLPFTIFLCVFFFCFKKSKKRQFMRRRVFFFLFFERQRWSLICMHPHEN